MSPIQYGQQFVGHPELTSVNQKLDMVLAVVLDQEKTGRLCRVMCFIRKYLWFIMVINVFLLLYSCKAREGNSQYERAAEHSSV